MHPTELIPKHIKSHLKRSGYNDAQASDVADTILTRYKRSQLKATEFIKEAEKYAREQFGRPSKA